MVVLKLPKRSTVILQLLKELEIFLNKCNFLGNLSGWGDLVVPTGWRRWGRSIHRSEIHIYELKGPNDQLRLCNSKSTNGSYSLIMNFYSSSSFETFIKGQMVILQLLKELITFFKQI